MEDLVKAKDEVQVADGGNNLTAGDVQVFSAPPASRPDADPMVKRELDLMSALDERVNPGHKMMAPVEAQYRSIITSHEQPPQSSSDKYVAIAGRMRMLEHFNAAGDNLNTLAMAIETAKRYPEVLDYSRFSKIAAANFVNVNPEFRKVLANASDDTRALYQRLGQPTPEESKAMSWADGQMIPIDRKFMDPDTRAEGVADYKEFIAGAEHQKPQDRADRKIAMAARMRLVDHMFDSGDNGATTQAMTELLTKYPEMMVAPRFSAIAKDLGLVNDEAFMRVYRKAGGDVTKLQAS